MGNQLTGIAPSQILPVEYYLTDVPDFECDSSLGSTRFFKVARAKHKEGLSVVKVFVIHDPSLPLNTYRNQLEDIHRRLHGASNCLPFQRATLSDRAALLFRQYVKDSLYDRISTRPFLNPMEKTWLAFQLLCALNQCHKLSVCHGDIKSENIMVTSWNWLLLADFASFKPTFLPEDNPADFSYFFDTSRRRTCYLAPERFVESSWRNTDAQAQAGNIDLTTNEIQTGDVAPAMDIFSAGCVITELFTEGSPPFDLSQLLAYRTGEYSPWKLLQKIEDINVRELVRHMIQKDPSHRLSAEQYLIQQRGKAFPDYYYTFLKLYLQRFASTPIMPADDRVLRIRRDLDLILRNLEVDASDPSRNASLVLVIALLVSCLRSLHHCHSKLVALEVMLKLSRYVTSDIVLDRLVPCMLLLANDQVFPRVRAEAVKTITQCVTAIKTVPISDANVFPEYILPQLAHIPQDPVAMVRVAYAENIALLAETALSFLEMVQLGDTAQDGQSHGDATVVSRYKAGYDTELQVLHEMIQQKVSTLLSDPDNIVKQTLLSKGLTRLCVFFGRQKANDILLSHTITFLNDKNDWQLRGAFFDSIVGVAAYVGWQSSTILKPLLEQGLSDVEEFVIHKTLCALTSLTRQGLLQKLTLHELLREVVPFLCHPNVWLRQGAVGFVSAVARTLNIADVHCNLLPLLQPHLKEQVILVNEEVVLLNALHDALPRAVYDYVLRSPNIAIFFESLQERKIVREACRRGHAPSFGEAHENPSQMFRKLLSQGMSSAEETKLLALRGFMLKVHQARGGSSDSTLIVEDPQKCGSLELASLGRNITRHHADLVKPEETKLDRQSVSVRKSARKKQASPEAPALSMNEDWKQMFESTNSTKAQSSSPQRSKPAPATQPGIETATVSANQSQASGLTGSGSLSEVAGMSSSRSEMQSSTDSRQSSTSSRSMEKPSVHVRHASCKFELHNLVCKKREQYINELVTKDLLGCALWENSSPPPGWTPRGQLVAHLHEHRGAVNRIQVSQDHSSFATCSNDGTVKLFDCSRMEGKSISNRSRYTYNKQGGQIKTLTFCDSSQSIASASDSGSIHVFKVDSPRINIQHTKNLDVEAEGLVVDMTYFDTGSQNVIAYATVHGLIIGWDLRTPRLAWQLKNDPKQGLITSFNVHPMLSWLAVATSSGKHICWDMRFQLPIATVAHPTDARVRRLVTSPSTSEQSWVISSVQGNNEVSMWDMETGARQKTLWASPAPPLSRSQASPHSVNGIYLGATDSSTFLLTAGSDMRLRYWDLSYPANSHIIAMAAADPSNRTAVSYRSRIIDGTEVIQETYGRPQAPTAEDIPRRGPDAPPVGHHDIVSDINMCQTSQCFIITCSRDGVVKVWK